MLLIEHVNGTVTTLEPETMQRLGGDEARRAAHARHEWPELAERSEGAFGAAQRILAMFCYEDASSEVTRFLDKLAGPLAARGVALHVFARKGFELDAPGAVVYVLGDGDAGTALDRVQQFTNRACNAFLKQQQNWHVPVSLLGCEWSAIPALSLLRSIKNLPTILSLHSIERQRSDGGTELGKQIAEYELNGLRTARMVLAHGDTTAHAIRQWAPDFANRVTVARPMFPVEQFAGEVDVGKVKARYNVGPVDPMIVYIGEMNERQGPDMLPKAMPAVLKKHPQARLVMVGDGSLYWPVRVQSRYLLLDHAIRMPGHLDGDTVCDLVRAADMIIVPSRDTTPAWPILAGWAASRPVVATREAAPEMLEHEHDAVLVYPESPSCAWGIDKVLTDPSLARAVARRGRQKLKERFGWDAIAAQVAEAMGMSTPHTNGKSHRSAASGSAMDA
jgi:glycosyltransferase involved in cell wall biosynthesis